MFLLFFRPEIGSLTDCGLKTSTFWKKNAVFSHFDDPCRQTETAEARSAGAVSVCRQTAGRSPIPRPVPVSDPVARRIPLVAPLAVEGAALGDESRELLDAPDVVARRGFTVMVGVDDAREEETQDGRVDGESSVGPYSLRATDLGARSGAVRAPHQMSAPRCLGAIGVVHG